MKKIGIGILSSIVIFLSGCYTYQGQLDTSVPMTEQITLVIHRPLTLKKVDGKDVDTNFLGWSPVGYATISIPAGTHELGISYESIATDGEYRHTIFGYTTITHEFEPGFKYSAYPYTEVLGAKIEDVDMAIMLELSDGFNVAIERKEKAANGSLFARETGIFWGGSMGPHVLGFDLGFMPFGFVVDTGKISYGFDTTISIGTGFRLPPLTEEFRELYFSKDKPMYTSTFFLDQAYSAGGLLSVYLNRDNGKAFGFGIGGGYSTSLFTLIEGDTILGEINYSNYPNVSKLPLGVWYIRGAIIPDRRTKFTIYFDYYLNNLLGKRPTKDDFRVYEYGYSYIDEGDYYTYGYRDPRNMYGFGLGIYKKLF